MHCLFVACRHTYAGPVEMAILSAHGERSFIAGPAVQVTERIGRYIQRRPSSRQGHCDTFSFALRGHTGPWAEGPKGHIQTPRQPAKRRLYPRSQRWTDSSFCLAQRSIHHQPTPVYTSPHIVLYTHTMPPEPSGASCVTVPVAEQTNDTSCGPAVTRTKETPPHGIRAR
jgi:hypothetical protein